MPCQTDRCGIGAGLGLGRHSHVNMFVLLWRSTIVRCLQGMVAWGQRCRDSLFYLPLSFPSSLFVSSRCSKGDAEDPGKYLILYGTKLPKVWYFMWCIVCFPSQGVPPSTLSGHACSSLCRSQRIAASSGPYGCGAVLHRLQRCIKSVLLLVRAGFPRSSGSTARPTADAPRCQGFFFGVITR